MKCTNDKYARAKREKLTFTSFNLEICNVLVAVFIVVVYAP